MYRFLPVVTLFIVFLVSCNDTGFIPDTDGDLDSNEIAESEEDAVKICEPGEWICYDDYSHWQCNEDGSDYVNLELCDKDQFCIDGECSEPICESGQWYCYDEYSVMQCNDNGTDYTNLSLCQPYEECKSGKCIESESCEAGVWVCFDSTSRWQCNEDGNKWENLEQCENGETCSEGECNSGSICVPNQSKCYDDKAKLTCNESGTGFLDLEFCGAGSYCEDGECVEETVDGDGETTPDGDYDFDTEFEIDPNTVFDSCNGMSNDNLRSCLYSKINNHDGLGYDNAKDAIFGDIDHHDGYVECVYTGRKSYIDRPDTDGMNTEHTWPQSLGAGSEPARGDMHHLFPTDSGANSRRSNYPFGVVVESSWEEGGSKLGYDENSIRVFEPRDEQKGDTARAIFYFSVRYKLDISYYQEQALKKWNHEDPPSEYEKVRNEAIYDYQDNYNPFVMRPDFVDLIEDF